MTEDEITFIDLGRKLASPKLGDTPDKDANRRRLNDFLDAYESQSTTDTNAQQLEWEYSVGGTNPSDGQVWADNFQEDFSTDPDEVLEKLEIALETGNFSNAIMVRRRKAGPWQEAPED